MSTESPPPLRFSLETGSPLEMPRVMLASPAPSSVCVPQQMLSDEVTSAAAPANAVSVKLPPYWPQDPILWFARAEAMFRTRGVTAQQTMFDYVIGSLDHEFAVEIRDILLSPPRNDPYSVLKRELIRRTQASAQQRLRELLSQKDLGDRKPSQLLRHMQQLLGRYCHGR